MTEVIEHLPNKHEALSSNPSSAKKKKTEAFTRLSWQHYLSHRKIRHLKCALSEACLNKLLSKKYCAGSQAWWLILAIPVTWEMKIKRITV
jgi:hypothetical protein